MGRQSKNCGAPSATLESACPCNLGPTFTGRYVPPDFQLWPATATEARLPRLPFGSRSCSCSCSCYQLTSGKLPRLSGRNTVCLHQLHLSPPRPRLFCLRPAPSRPVPTASIPRFSCRSDLSTVYPRNADSIYPSDPSFIASARRNERQGKFECMTFVEN